MTADVALRLPGPLLVNSTVFPASGSQAEPFVVYSSVAVNTCAAPIWFVAVGGVSVSRTSIHAFVAVPVAVAVAPLTVPANDASTVVVPTDVDVKVTEA